MYWFTVKHMDFSSNFSNFSWNQLDIIIVLLSIAGIVLEEMDTDVIPINPTIIRVMRVLRIARGEQEMVANFITPGMSPDVVLFVRAGD
jgi:hypothetical protein